MLQLVEVVQAAVESAVTRGVVNVQGLRPQASWDRIGRYARFGENGAGAWIGLRFDLWKQREVPLWLVFSMTDWGRGLEVHRVLEPWAAENDIALSLESSEVVLGLDLPLGVEKEEVVRSLVDRLETISSKLSVLPQADANPD